MDNQKHVILTFDDGFAAQFDIARPLLKKYGFTATFFICGAFIDHPYLKHTFMKWDQLPILVGEGFELGSHLYQHFAMIDPNINHFANIKKLEHTFKHHRLPKPVTLSYPGYHVDASAIKVVRSAGYKFARAGCEQSAEFDDFQDGGGGPHYDFIHDNPWNVNCTGIFGSTYGYEEFVSSLQIIEPGEIPVYCIHSFHGHGIEGAPQTDISPNTFERCLQYLKDNNYTPIRFRDIESIV